MKDQTTDTTLLSTGQFAKLCGIKKDTLFHYNDIGLLQPFLTTENGYRYYTTRELNLFHSITILQDAGLTLHEIKEFLSHENPYTLMPLLAEMEQVLLDKKRKFERLAAQVHNTLKSMEEAKSKAFFLPYKESSSGCLLAAMPTGNDKLSEAARTDILSQYYRYCMNNDLRADFFRGGIIEKEHFIQLADDFNYLDYLCIRLEKAWQLADFDENTIVEKPAGNYACINCPGGLENTLKALHMLRQYTADQGLKIIGDCYEFEIMGTFTVESESTCIKQIEVQVE